MNSPRNDWLPKKRAALGWGLPQGWQGWLCLPIYTVGMSLTFHFLRPAREPMAFAASVIVLTLLLVVVCVVKGGPSGRGPDS